MPEFILNNPALEVDLFHIDGMHEPDTDHDFQNSYKLAKNNAIMVWDDSDNGILNGLWQNYINGNKVIDISNEYSNTTSASNGHHAIGKIIK
jgi:hypothetical protein